MIVLVFYFFILFAFFNKGQEPAHIAVPDCINQSHVNNVLASLPESLFIKKIHVKADIQYPLEEFYQLLDVKPSATISRQQLAAGLQNLSRKKKFEHIALEITAHDTLTELTFFLKSYWTVSKIIIKSSLIGKEKYKQLYRFEPGDYFDTEKHAAARADLVKNLQQEGYFNAKVNDHIVYDQRKKEATVYLYLLPGKRYVIKDIDIMLQDNLDDPDAQKIVQKIRAMLVKGLQGSSFDTKLIQKNIQEIKEYLLRKGYYQAVLTQQELLHEKNNSARLLYTLTLKQRCRINFNGNHFFNKQTLLSVIAAHGTSFSLMPPHLFIDDLIALYKKNGFLHATISCEQSASSITFSVQENKRCTLAKILFEGVNEFSPSFLIKECFDQVLQHRFYDEDRLQKAHHKLLQLYHEKGFWDVALSCQLHFDNDNLLTLLFRVHEGTQRWYCGAELDPVFGILPTELFKKPSQPEPFRLSLVNEQQHYLSTHLHNKGYIYAKPTVEISQEDNYCTLLWRLQGYHQPTHFGNTIIQSSALPSSLILRELAYHHGEVWSTAKINQSLKNLKSLGLFESITIQPLSLSVPEEQKTMLINYTQDSPYELRGRAGFQVVGRHFDIKTATIKVGGSVLYKNATNNADTITIDTNYTRFERDVRFCYSTPWLGPYHLKTDFKVYSIRFDQPIKKGLVERLYCAIQDGFLFSFMHKTDHGQHTANVGFEWLETTGLSETLARKIDFEPELIGQKVPYFFFEPTCFIDYLDNQLNPSSGCLSLLSCKTMVPIKLRHAFFVKFLAEHSFFVPLVHNSVLAIRLRAGHIFNQSFKKIMPPERFYLGGAYSLRSYDPDMVPPLNCYTDKCGIRHTVPLGGKTMANVNVEVRFPLYKQLTGVIFQDAGILWQDHFAAITLDSVATATGAGLRLNTPVGPLRFDIGFKWKKSFEHESRFAWFLTLGNAF